MPAREAHFVAKPSSWMTRLLLWPAAWNCFDFKQMDLLSAEDKISVQIEQKLEIASFI